MQQYYDLERNILCCLLLKPSLMEQVKLEDKYFVKYQRLWQFMKAFYSKYQTFDLILMCNVCTDKCQLMDYIEAILDTPAFTFNFDKYQDQLIYEFERNKKEKIVIKHLFVLANKLFVGNIDLQTFYSKVEEAKEAKYD